VPHPRVGGGDLARHDLDIVDVGEVSQVRRIDGQVVTTAVAAIIASKPTVPVS
jgi:hypothetical protein